MQQPQKPPPGLWDQLTPMQRVYAAIFALAVIAAAVAVCMPFAEGMR